MHTNRNELRLRDIELLFRPFNHRKITLPSRVVMAPMSRFFSPDGIPAPEMALYYRRRAEHAVGLIITESASINEASASADTCMPQFHGGAALRAWKQICRQVHATQCRIAPQLCHVGMARPRFGDVPNPEAPPIGPSGIDPISLEKTGESMSVEKIAEVREAFAQAAHDAVRLGFDAVELQGAHGFLIDQFLWKETNKRHDIYGGDLVGRTRFACEVVQAVRKAVGRHFPIIFRFSQWKIGHYAARLAETPGELAAMLEPLSDAGVDVFDCSVRNHAESAFAGYPLSLAGWTRLLTRKPVISVGSVGLSRPWSVEQPSVEPLAAEGLDTLLHQMAAGEFDLIAVGRALLADAAWAEKVHHARESELLPFHKHSVSRLY